MTTENHPHEGGQSGNSPPGHFDPHAPEHVTINPEALKQGHEPDTVNLRAVLYVPIALVVTFIVTYAVVTIVVHERRSSPGEPTNWRLTEKRSNAPIDERIARISSTNPKAEYKQPRLEGAQQFKFDPSVAPNDPAYMRSRLPAEDGNSPHYHPEDLRPSSKVGKEMGLQDYQWLDPANGIARMPVEEAMKIILDFKVKDPKGKERSFLASKDVELSELLRQGPTPSNPQAGVTVDFGVGQMPPKKPPMKKPLPKKPADQE
jgi:hypothetical protein